MRRGWRAAALAAPVWALAVGALTGFAGSAAIGGPPGGGACELRRADRATATVAQCVGCHDGSVGPAVAVSRTWTPVLEHGRLASHPVDVDYGQAWMRRRDLDPSPRRELALAEGKVVCTTCHDGRSPFPNHLAVRTGLCQSCHRQ